MRQTIKLLFLSILLLTKLTSAHAQNNMKSSDIWMPISIDSVPNIQINRIVYYSKPIEFKFYALTDTTYIPAWYKTFCADTNVGYFKDYAQEAIHYFATEFGVTESALKNVYDKYSNAGGFQEYLIKAHEPEFMYIYDEIWITTRNDNANYLLLQGYNSEQQIKNLRFSTRIIANNIKNEKVDTMINYQMPSFIFKMVNDTLKWIDQRTLENIVLIDKHNIEPDLKKFKDMCYRRPKYIQSEAENGNRVFKTMEKDVDGVHKVTKVSDKPELNN